MRCEKLAIINKDYSKVWLLRGLYREVVIEEMLWGFQDGRLEHVELLRGRTWPRG